jgi:hypothetical protein
MDVGRGGGILVGVDRLVHKNLAGCEHRGTQRDRKVLSGVLGISSVGHQKHISTQPLQTSTPQAENPTNLRRAAKTHGDAGCRARRARYLVIRIHTREADGVSRRTGEGPETGHCAAARREGQVITKRLHGQPSNLGRDADVESIDVYAIPRIPSEDGEAICVCRAPEQGRTTLIRLERCRERKPFCDRFAECLGRYCRDRAGGGHDGRLGTRM